MDTLVVGLKGHGKTTALVQVAKAQGLLGNKVAVLTPVEHDKPRFMKAGAWVARDRAQLLDVLSKSHGVHVILDEVADTVGKHDKEIEVFCNKARHGGHALYFAGQRGTMMNVNVREQCTRLIMLRQPVDDCDTLARKFGCPELKEGWRLEPLEYMRCSNRVGSYRRGRLPRGM